MKLFLNKLNTTTANFIRVCGYVQITNPHNQETSYARALDPGRFYPRFHIYPDETSKQIIINLHLDAKRPSYQGTTAHSGEYDGPVVETEAARIQTIASRLALQLPSADQPIGLRPQKTFWQKLMDLFR